MGPDFAPVTVVAFSDFECQYCAKGHQLLKKLQSDFPGKVRIAFKNLPMSFHKNALPAACAAMAAHRQGKFWEMADLIFSSQSRLNEDFFLEAASSVQVDINEFREINNLEDWMDYFNAQSAEAAQFGISGTPTYIVNGIKVTGADYGLLKEAVSMSLASGPVN